MKPNLRAVWLRIALACCLFTYLQDTMAQPNPARWPALTTQLRDAKARPGTAFAALIRANQDFTRLRNDEKTDSRRLPPWLRVYWRKAHPELTYSADDPTGGYPLVLKEILEWMQTHQNLRAGPGREPDGATTGTTTGTTGARLGAVDPALRISGLQTVPRSESDIRINYFDPTKIVAGSNNIGGNGQQGMYYSTNTGASWQQTFLPLVAGSSFHSDPTVDWTSDSRAWSSTININAAGSVLRLYNYFSTDNGATWAQDALFSGAQTSADKQMVWIDHSSSSPYFNQTYAIWHNGNPAYMNRRTAGAAGTWQATPTQVSGAESSGTCIGSDVKTNSAGHVFGFWPTTSNRKILVVKSTNGGDTYGTPVQIATTYDGFDIGVPSFNGRRALIYVSGGAYKTASKDLVYASWTDLSGESGCTAAANQPGSNVASTCKTRIWFSRSIDGGATWQTPFMINNQSGLNDQFNQWLAVDETTGAIGIMYYDTEADPGRKKTHVYYQHSFDDGVTWSAKQQISTGQTDETIAGADGGNQYGDYNSLSSFAGVLFPSWTDRSGGLKEEIWTAKIVDPVAFLPQVVSAGATITAGNCNGTSSIDPGETVTVNLSLKNVGNANTPATLLATLQASGGVTSPSGTQNYGQLVANGATVSRPFTFTIDKACGDTVKATVTITDGGTYTYSSVTYTFIVGILSITSFYTEKFDGVNAPALPTGWTSVQTGTAPPAAFATTTTTPTSAPNAVFTNGSPSVASNSLISPVINIPSGIVKELSFQQTLNFEISANGLTQYDGAVLEVSQDGGTNFVDITAPSIGGTFTENGYTGVIDNRFSNPLGGRQGWGGQSGYRRVTVSLPTNFSGANIKFRWLAGWDNSTDFSNANWRIDDVAIATSEYVCMSCAEINVQGNAVTILDGDATPAYADYTDFGNVLTTATNTRTFTIQNTGTTPLNISNITTTGADNALFVRGGITLPAAIAPGSSTTFTINFSPATAGAKVATVNIISNDADEATYNFGVRGSGCAAPAMATTLDENTISISAGNNTVLANTGCRIIAGINSTATGTNVQGIVTGKVWVDPTQQTDRGRPYVRRHYQLTPATNAANAVAKVTLYFTQADFNSFNAFPNNGGNLPTGPTDNMGKTNLRIFKYVGSTSNPATGTPDTYPILGTEVTPDFSDIVWNSTDARWEVSFNVNGFSGFFAGNSANSILPVSLLQFSAALQASNALLKWQIAQPQDGYTYELQRSHTGSFTNNSFSVMNTQKGNATATAFNYTDAALSNGSHYYRLKMTDKNGAVTYSHIALLQIGSKEWQVYIYPNPVAKDHSVQVSITNGVVKGWKLTNKLGQVLMQQSNLNLSGSSKLTFSEKLPKGTYYLQLVTNKGLKTEQLLLQ